MPEASVKDTMGRRLFLVVYDKCPIALFSLLL